MDDREALRRAILDHPKDDAVRLVYADFLQENRDAVHAALIRVQCELASPKCKGARRKELARQEAGLLDDSSMHPEDGRRWAYRRGFVGGRCWLREFKGKIVLLTGTPHADAAIFSEGEYVEALGVSLSKTNLHLLDRVLKLELDIGSMDDEGMPSRRSSLLSACLRRVTSLECLDANPSAKWMDWLASCPELGNVASISIHDAGVVPLGSLERLILSPFLTRLSHLHLDGEDWIDDSGDDPSWEPDNPQVAAFVRHIGETPSSARLAHIQLNPFCGPSIARALIDSPHLHPRKIHLIAERGLRKGIKGALRKRFGKALLLS